ncbi:MAG: hypothetical protein AB1657_01345 [Candidatus Micrarchaeota archaeon]
MGATAVQANGGQKYERTADPRRMLTHKLLTEAIRTDWENVRRFLPARTATSIRYGKGATEAVAWDEGGKETKIYLPFENGWYVPDGNPFAIPNGRKSNKADPDALFLVRRQDERFSGPLGRGDRWYDDLRRRNVYAYDVVGWSVDSGVALVGRDAIVAGDNAPIERSVVQSGAAAPLVGVAQEKLVNVADPKALLERASQLEAAAEELTEKLGGMLSSEAYARLIKPTVDEAAFLRELAGKIESIQPKA